MSKSVATQVNAIVKYLESRANAENVAGMRRFGIRGKSMLGVSVTELRKHARGIEKNHSLALALWKTEIHEARILATLVDIPESVTEAQAERWAKTFDSWDIVDLCCNNLLRWTPFAHEKCVEWSAREEEFAKRAGFALMATLAAGDKKATDKNFEKFLPIIKKAANDERNFVKKAVNWALRQIGKRNMKLNRKAISTAKSIAKQNAKSARRIAADALRELESEKVRERLKKTK